MNWFNLPHPSHHATTTMSSCWDTQSKKLSRVAMLIILIMSIVALSLVAERKFIAGPALQKRESDRSTDREKWRLPELSS